MLSLQNLAKRHGAQTLFADVTMNLSPGCRYGIAGANGSGKSTLLRIVAGEEEASEGTVTIPTRFKIGWLKQDHFAYEEVPIVDVVLMGNAELYQAMTEKERLLARADESFDAERYAELEDIFQKHDGYSQEARAAEMLEGLNIEAQKHRQPMSVLSGGYKLRVLLAQTLASSPDVLLLDEPTNHLDILSIRWLEKFLLKYRGCVLTVSHDRRFLNAVCSHIIDIDYEKATLYKGDYDHFEKAKVEHRERQEAEIDKRKDEIAEHKAFIERFKAKATKARQANSRQKRMEKIVIEKLPETSRRYPRFFVRQKRPTGRMVVSLENIRKTYGERHVLDRVSLTVNRGDRMAIIGPNGIGKSTLLKVMVSDTMADTGKVEWGHETQVGYFSQDHGELAKNDETVHSWLWRHAADQTNGFIRSKLAEVLFGRDDVEKKLRYLSGGESARLLFARLGVTQPNVLVLDEPTNHLDLEGIEALADGLADYDGTIVFVSHDRWFVEQLATRVVELRPSGIEDYPGGYVEYVAHCGDDHLDAEAVAKRTPQTRRLLPSRVAKSRATTPE